MQDFTMLFLYIPGIVIFLLGSGQFRTWLSTRGANASAEGTVISCRHVIKKDAKGRETFNFYNTVIEYVNTATGNREQHAIKTPTEYAAGQPVILSRVGASGDVTIQDAEGDPVFHPFIIMVGGALMILLSLWQNQNKPVHAMTTLAIILAGAGICMVYHYVRTARKRLVPVEAEIIDTYSRQISKSTKIVRGDKFTYYPIVKYSVNGHDGIRRCHMNSDSEKLFKIGDTITLYYDEATKRISEEREKLSVLIGGIILVALGCLIALSVIAEALRV